MKGFEAGGRHDQTLYGRWSEWGSDQRGVIVVHARDEACVRAEGPQAWRGGCDMNYIGKGKSLECGV